MMSSCQKDGPFSNLLTIIISLIFLLEIPKLNCALVNMLMSQHDVKSQSQTHGLWTMMFWTILVTFIFDIKIDVNMYEPNYFNLFFGNLLHSPHVWLFDIWHLFENLTSFWQFDIFLTHEQWGTWAMGHMTSFWQFDTFKLKPPQPVTGLFFKFKLGDDEYYLMSMQESPNPELWEFELMSKRHERSMQHMSVTILLLEHFMNELKMETKCDLTFLGTWQGYILFLKKLPQNICISSMMG